MGKCHYNLFFVFLLGMNFAVNAQEKVEATLSSDFVSQYVWRGEHCGSASVQPMLGLSWKGLELSAWGSVGLTDSHDTREIDLSLSYTMGGLTVGIIDYWFDEPDSRYFCYKAHDTSHLFEAFACYDFGLLNAAWYTNFAGNDGVDKKGRRAYSSYFELTAPFRLASCDWEAAIGVVPYATTYYDNSCFSVTNLSLKALRDIRFGESFVLPVFCQIVANPYSQKAFFIFGLTLK